MFFGPYPNPESRIGGQLATYAAHLGVPIELVMRYCEQPGVTIGVCRPAGNRTRPDLPSNRASVECERPAKEEMVKHEAKRIGRTLRCFPDPVLKPRSLTGPSEGQEVLKNRLQCS